MNATLVDSTRWAMMEYDFFLNTLHFYNCSGFGFAHRAFRFEIEYVCATFITTDCMPTRHKTEFISLATHRIHELYAADSGSICRF